MALPFALKPQHHANLVRLGQDFDGGYLVDLASVEQADLLLSFGISFDCSFETELKQRYPTPIIAYDHTVDTNKFMYIWRRAYKFPPVTPKNIKRLFSRIRAHKEYHALFSQSDVEHRPLAIGYPCRDGVVDILTIMNEVPQQRVFFKIDIEGSEYGILEQLIQVQDRMTGLAIEFHDCDRHTQEITQFIERFALPLVHIHGNNFGGTDSDNDPYVLELTFGHPDCPTRTSEWTPSPLDQPNDPRAAEFPLHFQSS